MRTVRSDDIDEPNLDFGDILLSSRSGESGPWTNVSGGMADDASAAVDSFGSNKNIATSGASSLGPAQRSLNVPDDHQVFVGFDDAHFHASVRTGNKRCVGVIAWRVELNAEKVQAGADPFAHRSRMFANASGEHEKIKAAQSGGIGTDELLSAIAEEIDGFGSMRIMGRFFQQIAHVFT